MEAWIDWLIRIVAPGRKAAQQQAYTTVATLDGLLLLRHTCSANAANAAARGLGITTT